jgi:hypothetical protein
MENINVSILDSSKSSLGSGVITIPFTASIMTNC